MKSLRRNILLWMALLLFAVGTVSAIATYELVKDETQSSFDAEIRQIAEFLQAEQLSNFTGEAAFGAPNPDHLFLIQIWNDRGELVRSSDKTASASPPAVTGFTTQNLGQGDWRSYSIVSNGQKIRVSLPLDERNEQASTAALQIAIPMAVVIPLSWVVLSLLIDRILGGLDKTARQVAARNQAEASPISMNDVPSEIVPFVEEINRHVDRVQAQAEKHKQFLSDAAHELRTPLAALSIQIGNLGSVLKTEEQLKRHAVLVAGSARANMLVSRLLQLARHDEAFSPPNSTKSELYGLLTAICAAMRPLASQRGVLFDEPAARESRVTLDAEDFRQVMEVLIDNAIRYCKPGASVSVTATSDTSVFEVRVSDEGPGIAEDKLPRVFDRFFRADPHASPGTGLGLSIAKAICAKHQWTISLRNRQERGGLEAIISGKVAVP